MNKFRKELGEGKILTKDSKFPIGKEIYKMVNFRNILNSFFTHRKNSQTKRIK